MVVHCPTCHRVGASAEEIQARCGSFMTCAKRVIEVDPAKEVVIQCASCDVALAIPASIITSGKAIKTGALCQRSPESCLASVVASVELTSGEPQVTRAPRGKSAKS